MASTLRRKQSCPSPSSQSQSIVTLRGRCRQEFFAPLIDPEKYAISKKLIETLYHLRETILPMAKENQPVVPGETRLLVLVIMGE